MTDITLIEKHIIKKNHIFYKECDQLCFLSKNLYNHANYILRNEYISNKTYLNYYDMNKIFIKNNSIDYISLPRKVSNQTLRLLDKNWKSFFKAIKDYTNNPHKYLGKPKIPKYKHKATGRFIAYYDKGAISKKSLNNNIIKLSKTDIAIKTKVNYESLVGCRIVPRNDHYVIEVIYKKEIKPKIQNNNIMSIDLGIDNFATCVMNNNKNKIIINGKTLKSINQYYNKKKSILQSKLKKDQKRSNRLMKLTNKRNNKINDYMHKSSRYIIDYCLTNDIGKIIIGKNKHWKQNVNIGKRNNQSFVNIPFNTFIHMLEYKGLMEGIEVIQVEESYTSKCSFIDNETLCKKENYMGKRTSRGMFVTSNGICINADVNSAYNIMKKVVPQVNVHSFMYGIEDIAVYPIRVLKHFTIFILKNTKIQTNR